MGTLNKIMDLLRGQVLCRSDGKYKKADDVIDGKDVILIYFAANWCPPCRSPDKSGIAGFSPCLLQPYSIEQKCTPYLKDFYQNAKPKGVEIIFVSADRTKVEMMSYMQESHGDWFAIDHGSKLSKDLKKAFKIKGIPHLGVLKTDGSIISKNGHTAVEGDELVPFLSRCEDWTCKDIPLKLTKVGNKVE